MKKYIYRFVAMSTPCELLLYSNNKTLADTAAKAVLSETKRLEKKYNYYSKDSLLFSINSRTSSKLDSETKSILQCSKLYYKETEGIFDVTIATIKDLYREEKDENEFQREKDTLQEYIGCEHFAIKKEKIIFDNPHTKIDLGGFVKEYSVDRAIMLLKKHKIGAALVNYGGDIYALGKKPNNEKFTIGIKDPNNLDAFATHVTLEDEALTTSASYERNYTIGSQTYSHILSKNEMTNNPNSVSVISKNCVESGIYSTALMIEKTLQTKNKIIVL